MYCIADFHSHYSFHYYDRDVFKKELQSKGIDRVCVCSTSSEQWQKVLNIGDAKDKLLPFIGTHPWFLDSVNDSELIILEDYLRNSSCGIGEVGLDFMRPGISSKKDQISYLKEVLQLAEKYKRAVNIHCVKAENELLRVLRENRVSVPLIFHAARFSQQMFINLSEFKCFFSVSPFTLKSVKVQQMLKHIPLSQIVFESDYENGANKDILGAVKAFKISLKYLDVSRQDLVAVQNKNCQIIKESLI